MSIKEKAKKLIREAPESNQVFKLKYFVINKEANEHGAADQCLTEIKSRLSEIENIDYLIDDINDEIELKKIEFDDLSAHKSNISKKTIIQTRIIKRAIDRLNKKLHSLKKDKDNLEVELFFLSDYFEKNFKNLDYSEESLKAYWNARLEREIALRALTGSPVDLELLKTVLAMPDDSKVKIDVSNSLNKMKHQLREVNIQR
jgi:DNA repair ATPase RecN